MQQHHGQDEHVGEVERLAGEEDDVFPQRMPGALEVVVGWGRRSTRSRGRRRSRARTSRRRTALDVLEAVQRQRGSWGVKRKMPRPVRASSSPWRLMQEWWPRWCRMRHMYELMPQRSKT